MKTNEPTVTATVCVSCAGRGHLVVFIDTQKCSFLYIQTDTTEVEILLNSR